MKIRRYQMSDETAVVALWHACNLVGTVMAGYEGHRGWLNYLAVAPEQRKRGIGSELVRHAVSAMQKLGCQKINLQVRESNVDVLAFYEAIGFTRDGVVSLGLRLPRGGCS